jgi:hypothetical protein
MEKIFLFDKSTPNSSTNVVDSTSTGQAQPLLPIIIYLKRNIGIKGLAAPTIFFYEKKYPSLLKCSKSSNAHAHTA